MDRSGGASNRGFQSDLAGNITQDATVSPALTKVYSYNAAGQLSGATANGTTAGAYIYDYLSRLVSRTISASSTTLHMVHDLDGNVIAEYDASGTLITEYISVEGRPLAMVADAGATPALYYVLTDQLERPVMMTDHDRNVVWQASYLPFGEVRSISGTATLNQRFPGQWFQIETGLAYNWHRHYDPSIGRYLQPDPLGMPDGPSRWAYVKNSPLMNVDPTGLFSLKDFLWTPQPLWPFLLLPEPKYCEVKPYAPDNNLLPPVAPPILNNEETPTTNPENFNPVKGTSGKQDNKTGEIWEKDKLHKDHYEVYKNRKDYEKGRRDRDVWLDGRPKRKF